MCGRFGLWLDEGFYDRFEIENKVELPSSYNTAPGMMSPVVTRNSPNKAELMKWGLLPPWAKDPRIAFRMINARAETVTGKPAYRKAFKSQRCLVPANGFYEWEREGKEKTPYFFRDRKARYLAFAGLYEVAHDADNKEIKTFTIITTKANMVVGKIHDRMPVILTEQEEGEWLNHDTTMPRLKMLLDSYASKTFEGYEVSGRVNSAANNDPSLVEPLA